MSLRNLLMAGALLIPGGLFAQVTETALVDAMNSLRAQARACGAASMPAVKPLRINPALTAAANKMIANQSGNPLQDLAANNILAFAARTLYWGQAGDAKTIANGFATGDPIYCQDLMSGASEVGVGTQKRCEYCSQEYLAVLAETYDPAKVEEYRARMFAELNRIRQSGINPTLYPGAKCSSAPLAAFKWNDKVAEAAQFHSNDYAAKGVTSVGGSPHTGTAGELPADRLKAAGCPFGGENAMFNFGNTPEEAVRGWIGLSAGHCGNLVNAAHTVAGLGIAHSAGIMKARSGPFVTLNIGNDSTCAAYTKTAPGGSPQVNPVPTPTPTPTPTPSTSGCAADTGSFSVYSAHSWAKFEMPAGKEGQVISIPGGAHNEYVFPACNRVWWDNLQFACTGGKWKLKSGRYDADGLCHGSPGSSPYVKVGKR